MPKLRKKKKGRGGVLRGTAFAVAAILLMLSFYALAVSKNPNLADYAKTAVTLINIIAAVICGMITARNSEQRTLLLTTASGVLLFTIIMLTAIITDLECISAKGVCEILLISLGGNALGYMLKLCNSNKKLRFKSGR